MLAPFQKLPNILGQQMLPLALKSSPDRNKSPNLITLQRPLCRNIFVKIVVDPARTSSAASLTA